jgi:hypothetical protein
MLYAPSYRRPLKSKKQGRPANERLALRQEEEGARNFRDYKLTIGFDLGDRSSWCCVLDESGAVLPEQKLSTSSQAMREMLGGTPGVRVALETMMHSPGVSRLWSELGTK